MLIRRLEVLKLIVYSYMESNKFNADSSDSNEIEKTKTRKKGKKHRILLTVTNPSSNPNQKCLLMTSVKSISTWLSSMFHSQNQSK